MDDASSDDDSLSTEVLLARMTNEGVRDLMTFLWTVKVDENDCYYGKSRSYWKTVATKVKPALEIAKTAIAELNESQVYIERDVLEDVLKTKAVQALATVITMMPGWTALTPCELEMSECVPYKETLRDVQHVYVVIIGHLQCSGVIELVSDGERAHLEHAQLPATLALYGARSDHDDRVQTLRDTVRGERAMVETLTAQVSFYVSHSIKFALNNALCIQLIISYYTCRRERPVLWRTLSLGKPRLNRISSLVS